MDAMEKSMVVVMALAPTPKVCSRGNHAEFKVQAA